MVIYVPADEHRCVVFARPGGAAVVSFNHPEHDAQPGTVIECDCGRTFVAQEWQAGEMFPRWRREGWFARRRRCRRKGASA